VTLSAHLKGSISQSIMKQGTKANKTGHRLEDKVEKIITDTLNISAIRFSQTKVRDNILLTHAPYTNIYGNTKCRSEFLLCYKGRKIRIECKFQQSAGSVDEKLPYLYMNFTKAIKEKEAIIVVEGNGFKKGAKEWLREKCSSTKVSVMSLDEFQSHVAGGIPKKNILTKLISWVNNG
tara:strand:- start:970 stop:1503 length:534 start_codon:yes stop_codon:yes gene_type:complete